MIYITNLLNIFFIYFFLIPSLFTDCTANIKFYHLNKHVLLITHATIPSNGSYTKYLNMLNEYVYYHTLFEL